jgi:hypothetical protein
MTPSWDELWSEAKQSDDINRLGEIGMTMLDGIDVDNDAHAVVAWRMARVQWIVYRIEFLRIARSMQIHAKEGPFKPRRDNPYAANSGKFGPIRHEDSAPVYPTGDWPPDKRAREITQPIPKTGPLDDRIIPFTQLEPMETRAFVPCGQTTIHPPHVNGDGWCGGESAHQL